MGKKKPVEAIPDAPKPWTLTQEDLDATTDKEYWQSTVRCLPPENIIPDDFWKGNIYTQMVDAMFIGEEVPNFDVTFNEGFTGHNLLRFLEAHLRSVEPEYEHKIAGLAYMISRILTVKESK